MAAVRFGLIGYGAWGSHHARVIAKTEGAELVAIAARSEASQAAARAAHPNVAVHGDYRELLRRPDLDAVSVVLPSDLHFAVGRAVLESGRHLLLEKPMALTVADCAELNALARRQGKLLAVGFECRLSRLWGKVKELVDAGAVGEPRYALIELWRRPYRQGSQGWRYDIHRVGDWILEEPIHFFDLARWYFSNAGEPETVYARANSRQAGHPELQDNFSAILDFPGGRYAVISQTLSAFGHHQTVKLAGTTGALWASWHGADARDLTPRYSLQYFDGREVLDLTPDQPAGELVELEDEIRDFTTAIREHRRLAATGEDGLWSVLLCQAARVSVQRGAPVHVCEFIPDSLAAKQSETPPYLAIPRDELGKDTPVRVRVVGDVADLADDMAEAILQVIEEGHRAGRAATLIVPVGPVDQFPVLARRINERHTDCRDVVLINMDEYLSDDDRWIDIDHPLSFRGFMNRRFYDLLDPSLAPREENRVFPDPRDPDAIGRLIERRGGVDACFGGIGINGHIAFNEPPEPGEAVTIEGFAALPTRVLALSRETCTINSVTVGGEIGIVPRRAITLGMREILASRRLRFYCNRPWQRAVVRRALHGPLTPACPASYLRTHRDAELTVTEHVAEPPDIQLR
jgi:predicted dehydrogenase/6-phosphogluconolactonase/glucosamine-6-phosphate isomerase/deaminase